jgi:type I restriction-modification system DNA methylase subunit
MLDDIKKTIWASADKLRANMDAAEYKHLVLGLIFVKYISDAFVARQTELTDEVIERISQTVVAWRTGTDDYQDIAGFCRSVPLTEIAQHGHVLTPGRYVGAEEVDDDDEAFADKMQMLTAKLGEQMAKGADLDALIRQKLGGLGYEF